MGYRHEPERESGDSSDEKTSSESGGDESPSDSDHGADNEDITEWCSCNNCDHTLLVNKMEYVCCKVLTRVKDKTVHKGESSCITNNADFATVCLNDVVLRVILVCLSNVRGDDWDLASNRSLRWAAYRTFTWWVHGRLGKSNRRVSPACCLHRIRSTFPKSEHEEYEGYKNK